MLHIFLNILQQTLIFLPLAFGMYISFEILKVTDLTVEGTFILGAAVFARLVTLGFNQTECVIFALLGGAIVGFAVGMMQRVAKINSLIASILAVFMLFSVNFGIMSKPNISLLNSNIYLQHLQDYHATELNIFLILFVLFLAVAIITLLHSKLGLYLRSFGSNPGLLKKLGKSPVFYLCIGLAISNMFAALCGVMTAQLDGYADIHMGTGMALTAIAAVVIGTKLMTTLFRKTTAFKAYFGLMSCFVGAFIYFSIFNVFLILGINPIYLKLVLGILLVIFLSSAHYSKLGGKTYVAATQT